MYSYFTELHVDLLSQALLQPGERRIGATVGRYVPWWAFGFVNETYLVIATDRRIILVGHKMAWLHQATKLTSVESLAWQGVQEARVTGIFGKKLRLRGQGLHRPFARKLRVPNPLFGLLAPMPRNVEGARTVAQAYQASRGLPAAAAAPQPALPPAQPAWQPAAQAPELPPAAAQPPPPYLPPASAHPQSYLPPVNAPGYASVPPVSQPAAPSARAGIAPTPPRSFGPRPPTT
jgi:hypothetical protein